MNQKLRSELSRDVALRAYQALLNWALYEREIGEVLDDSFGVTKRATSERAAKLVTERAAKDLRESLRSPHEYEDAAPAIAAVAGLIDWTEFERSLHVLVLARLREPPMIRAIEEYFGGEAS